VADSPLRFFTHGPGHAAWNMAFDEALLHLSPLPVLRFYQWSKAVVSIGYFQSWKEAGERPFVRRYTGGGLVDHAHDFTYSVTVPKGHRLDARGTANSYREIHEAVAEALRACDIPAEVTPETEPEPNAACFQRAVRYDIVLQGQKIAGAAQRRSRKGTLHQGSILLSGSYDRKQLAKQLQATLSPLLADSTTPGQLTGEESTLLEKLKSEQYESEEWNQQK